jgi:tRNA threonylcarbamoyladenosine biosynthesis protein TsaB
MTILALDTATRATAVALCTRDAREFERRDDPPAGARPGHASQALPLIVAALRDAGLDWPHVDRIAVGTGPGTFTGLRIGIATARALSQARSIPLVGVSTLQSLALIAAPSAREARAELVAGVIDARRGELFAAAWERSAVGTPGSSPLLEPRPYAPQALAEELARLGHSVLAVGDGALASRELLEGCGVHVPQDESDLHRVSAIGHCRLAAAVSVDSAAPVDPLRPAGAVTPAYLRLPDAELARRAAQK